MMMMMMMKNCFRGMVDRRKAFSLISSRDHCQRFSPSQISDTLRAGFEPSKNLRNSDNHYTTAPHHHHHLKTQLTPKNLKHQCSLLDIAWLRKSMDTSLKFSEASVFSKNKTFFNSQNHWHVWFLKQTQRDFKPEIFVFASSNK